jgi:phospholipase C
MTSGLRAKITGMPDFYRDADAGTLPAVSFVRPYEPYSGHPANSAIAAYEYFVTSISNTIIKHRELFADTAILVTLDEGAATMIQATFSRWIFSAMAREFR